MSGNSTWPVKTRDTRSGTSRIKHRRQQVRAVGAAVLLAGGLISYNLGTSAPAQAVTAHSQLAAKALSPAATGGPAANFQNAGKWGTCLDADSNHYPSNGDILQLWTCNTNPEQKWVLTSAGQLQNAGKNMCLDVDSNHYPSNGDKAQLWTCNTNPEQEWRFDWASSSFCASHDVPYMGTTFDGVAACGVPFKGTSSNTLGRVTYNGVLLDSVGFQCVELAARYFYYVTGQIPPGADGGAYAWAIHTAYKQQYGIFPSTATGVSTYQNTLVPGDIISMWSSGDKTGHVGVVTSVSLNSSLTGKINMINENANANGTDTITVTNGKMTHNSSNEFQWVYNLPG